LLAFALTLLPFIGLGLISASFIIVFKQGSPISMLMAMGTSLLSGVLYPVAVLPDWLKPVSSLLPVTHGLEAIRQVLTQSAISSDIADRLFYLTIFSVIFLSIGIYSIHKSLSFARKEGTLLHY
jgi:ABC-2 type transport system permease protein